MEDDLITESIRIEYHHDHDSWFLSKVVGGMYRDFSLVEDGDPNELSEGELIGDWQPGIENQAIANRLCEACVCETGEWLEVRGVKYQVDAFSAFHLGYDMIRFRLVPVVPTPLNAKTPSVV